MKAFLGFPLGGLFLTLASSASAAVLISDNFNNLALNANLQTRTPDGTSFVNNVNAGGWITNTALLSGNGSGGLSANNFASRNALIDLGADYFVTNPGIYTLTVTMTTPTGLTGSSWVGLGFSPINTSDQSFNGLNAAPWLLHRNTGDVGIFGGPNNTNGTNTTATTGTAHTFRLTLDTSTTQWTLQASIDSVAVDLNGGTAGTAFTYASNPTSSRYLGIAMANNLPDTGAVQTLDNFLFEGPVPIPEPTTASLAVAAAGLLTLRRRR